MNGGMSGEGKEEDHFESQPRSCGTVCCLFKRNDSERERGMEGWRESDGGVAVGSVEAAGADAACDTLRWRASGRPGRSPGLQGVCSCLGDQSFPSPRAGVPPSLESWTRLR